MNYYYPYSATYLSQKMRQLAAGLVKLAIFVTSALIVAGFIAYVWHAASGWLW